MMEVLKKQVKLETFEYYITHLSLVNPLLPVKLSPKEIEVLAIFMSFTGTLSNDRFGTSGKKIVRETLKLSHPGIANYIISLTKKGFIKKINGKMEILPILHPKPDQQCYEFKLINKDYEN